MQREKPRFEVIPNCAGNSRDSGIDLRPCGKSTKSNRAWLGHHNLRGGASSTLSAGHEHVANRHNLLPNMAIAFIERSTAV
jgi:hypothetical protein